MSRREILVLSREAMPAGWLPREGAVALAWERVAAWLDEAAAACRWMARAEAESDPRWKQPIPYLLLRDTQGAVAAYERAGSEGRLHGLWSVGLGGHVERADERPSVSATLLACAHREIAEELELGPADPPELRFLGVVNEDVTEVGRVHWGLVLEARCSTHPRSGPELGGLRWLLPEEAAALPLERWSRLALGLLAGARPDGRPAVAGRVVERG